MSLSCKNIQSFAISVAMVSLIKKKELHEMQPTDYVINGDEKIFLEEQLKYYFEFSDNRWNLNVVESQLDVSIEVNLLAPIYKKSNNRSCRLWTWKNFAALLADSQQLAPGTRLIWTVRVPRV